MQQTAAHRSDIDGLRAVAIVAVLAFDASARWLRGGYLGIDVFFVVSGYLISLSILADLESGIFDLPYFYRWRVRRALPALLTVLLAVFVFGWFFLFAREYRQLGEEIAAGAAFASNLLSWSARAGGDTGILSHLWSVAILGQFCLVWPALLQLASRYREGTGLLIPTLLALSFGVGLYWSYTHPTAAFYSPVSRVWELMAGWVLARLERQGWRWDPAAANTAATFGCLLLAIGFLLVDAGHPFPGWRALLPVLGTCLVLSAGPEAWINRKILGNRILAALGLISYPLYLWHWPALGFARLFDSGTPAGDVRLAVLAAALCLAIATHLLIERPLRRPCSRLREDVETAALLAGAVATCALGIVCFASNGFPGTGFRDPARQAFLDSFEGAALPAGCTERCTERDPGRHHAVLLWGDEDARALYTGLRQNLPADWQILQVALPGCLPEAVLAETQTFDSCEQSNRAALRTIAAARPEVVIVAHDRGQSIRRFHLIADRLHELGVARTLFTGPAPHWVGGLPTVVARHFWPDPPRRTFVGLDPQFRTLNGTLERNFTTTDTMAFVDVIGLFCSVDGCLTWLGDDRMTGLTSQDGGHLRPIASDHLARELLARMVTGSVRD